MQRTTNYGLCQYEGSDKTSYLVNYNDDMLKIDTAIKNASDGGAGAQTTADRAESKADTNTGSINTLNTQINGAGGIASDLSTVVGNVQTINSLIGNGAPTTADQTIIGAINGLEGAVAPREDGNTLANSYAIGEQFARGGSVYEALTTLTAGSAFASLTLNTDYKVSNTLVKQIADVEGETQNLAQNISNKYVYEQEHSITITPDTTKSVKENMQALQSELSSYLGGLIGYGFIYRQIAIEGQYCPVDYSDFHTIAERMTFTKITIDNSKLRIVKGELNGANSYYGYADNDGTSYTFTDESNDLATNSAYSIKIGLYKKIALE